MYSTQNPHGQLLLAAHNLLNGDKQCEYGDPRESHMRIAAFWSTYLSDTLRQDIQLNATDVAMMMALLKISREISNHKRDNLLDCAAYLALAEDLWSKP